MRSHNGEIKLIPHPHYSPDLATSDFFLSPNLKKWLGGKKISTNVAVEEAVNDYFSGLEKTYFSDG